MPDWIRTCQECMYQQISKPPAEYKDTHERWRDLKCKRCKSTGSLDYGRWAEEGEQLNQRKGPINAK